MPFHYTLLYGCNGFSDDVYDFFLKVLDPNHPLYNDQPKPIGFDIFPNKKKNYNALAIKYEWPVGKAVNTALSSNKNIFPGDPELGFNGGKYQAHVTVAYIDGNIPLDKVFISSKIEEVGLSFFDVTIKGITLEISAKPESK